MSRALILLTCAPANPPEVDGWLAEINALAGSVPDVVRSAAGRVLPDRKGPVDIVWSLVLESHLDRRVPAIVDRFCGRGPVRLRELLPVQPFAEHRVDRADGCALRTLLIRVLPGTGPGDVAGLEAALIAMPARIPSIRSWALSHLDPARTAGGWTHLWEQEFDDPRGFRPYMAHPYHWTGVERWFDPEIPGFVVDAEEHYITQQSVTVIGTG